MLLSSDWVSSSTGTSWVTMSYKDHYITDPMDTSNSTDLSGTSQCFVLPPQGLMPWDNPDNLVTLRTEDLVRRLKDGLILPLLFLIGGPANVINMVVFYKQGLKERINVCLFSLSLADFLYLLYNMILHGEQIHLQFTTKERYGPIMRFIINHNLLGFYGFTWVSQLITAIIASERCFCILQPLRSQTVLRTSTTTAIIVVINITMLAIYSMVTNRFRLTCAYDPVTKASVWLNDATQFYKDNHKFIDIFDGFVLGIGVPGVVVVVVTVTTVVTIIKLRQAAAWRAGTSSSSSVSAREVALTIMLVYNSIFFFACVFPMTLFRVVWLFLPEINAGRQQHNLFFTCLWILDSVTYINATFNFIIYYTMGSRYREAFWQLLGRDKKTNKMTQDIVTTTTAAS